MGQHVAESTWKKTVKGNAEYWVLKRDNNSFYYTNFDNNCFNNVMETTKNVDKNTNDIYENINDIYENNNDIYENINDIY